MDRLNLNINQYLSSILCAFISVSQEKEVNMANWNEADHPRDDEGKFTYKNGGSSSSNTGILKGGVEKVKYPDDWGGGDSESGGIGSTIGDILTGVLGVVLNPQTIQAVLGILAAKYTVSEMKKIKEELYEYMEQHSNSSNESTSNTPNNDNQTAYDNIGLGMNNSLLTDETKMQYNSNEVKKNTEDILFKNTGDKEQESKVRNKLLDVLGDYAEREDIFYSTVPELLEKIKKYGLDTKSKFKQIFAEFGLDKAYNSFGYWYAKNNYGEDTVGMVDLAHEKPINPNYGANTIELNSYEDITNISDRKYLEEKLTEQFKDYGYDIKDIKELDVLKPNEVTVFRSNSKKRESSLNKSKKSSEQPLKEKRYSKFKKGGKYHSEKNVIISRNYSEEKDVIEQSENNNDKNLNYDKQTVENRTIMNKIKFQNWQLYFCFLCLRKFKNYENSLIDEGMQLITCQLDIRNIFKNMLRIEKVKEQFNIKDRIQMSNECKNKLNEIVRNSK